MSDAAPPGNLLQLLGDTVDEALEDDRTRLHVRDFVVSLSGRTGLPLAILDRETSLDLDDVEAFFERRVLHQDEAVRTVVERIALVKAGLTDPDRPLGVLLFVGPTGTGEERELRPHPGQSSSSARLTA